MFYVDYNWGLMVLWYAVIFLPMLLIAQPQKTFSNPQINNVRKGTVISFILFTLGLIFSFQAHDTYHSWDGFIVDNQYSSYRLSNYEAIYNWLGEVVDGDYWLWRTCIFLPVACLYFVSARRLNILNRNFLLVTVLWTIFLGEYRNSLGFVAIVYGMILLADGQNATLTRIIGLVLFCLSYFLHSSMYITIGFAILALFPFGKKGIIVSLIVFPFLTTVATYIVDGIVGGSIGLTLGEGVGGYGDKTLAHTSGERRIANINGIITNIVTAIPGYLILFYTTKRVVFDKVFKGISKERVWVWLFRFYYVSFYIGSLFMFVETSNWIPARFKLMGTVAMVLVLAKSWSLEPKGNKLVKAILIFKGFALTWKIAYQIYKW